MTSIYFTPPSALPRTTAYVLRPALTPALTGREHQIVALIAQGHSNREISEQLYLSINSVKTYIRSAYRKIGVTRRTQAVIWFIEDERRRADGPR
jgi:DNA-binding CsgD family transcriptional regulator